MGNLLAWLIAQDQAQPHDPASRAPRQANPREARQSYAVALFLSKRERAELMRRPEAERRSRSSYVTLLVLDDIGRPRRAAVPFKRKRPVAKRNSG